MKKYIEKLRNKEHLSQAEIEEFLHGVMSGSIPSEIISDFLLALNAKGPTIDEITGAAKLLQKFYIPVPTHHEIILDTCGTGGDQKHTFNISTIVAFVVAGCGVIVAKHGNRSVSSSCGSADVLEALGVNLNMDNDRLGTCLDEVGIAFLFAQKLHPAMKNVAAVRKALGVKTIFNILGPLINPARATHQIMGVYRRELIDPIAEVLKNLGLKKALVVHGGDGLDEITTTTKTYVSEWDGAQIVAYDIEPNELGIPIAEDQALKGGDVAFNAKIVDNILSGQAGPQRDIVLLNAAYALYAADKVGDIGQGLQLAADSIDKGLALKKLQDLKEFSNQK